MKLRDILDLLGEIAVKNGISTPKICGGIARSKAIQTINKSTDPIDIADLDITTGDSTIHSLAKLFTIEMSKTYDVQSRQMNDNHTSVFFEDFKIDFSSNYITPGIDKMIVDRGFNNPTPLLEEMFSRDFTCNALLLSLDFKTIQDPTKLGITAIKNKVIKTCLDPHTTFTSNHNRLIRVIYMAAKLGFTVDEDIITWIKEHRQLINLSSDSYITKYLNKSFTYNKEITIDLLNKMGLWTVLPITEELLPFYQASQPARQKLGQIFTNFDYGIDSKSGPGPGLYSELDKYKSVSDFRKKRRKRRKDTIKKMLATRPK